MGEGPITKAMLEGVLEDVRADSGKPHVHIIHPDGGRCECGLYVTKEMLDGR